MDPTRRALFMCAASCQGGHSAAGKAAADVLGVSFPITMRELCKAVKREGEKPTEFYPWMKVEEEAQG